MYQGIVWIRWYANIEGRFGTTSFGRGKSRKVHQHHLAVVILSCSICYTAWKQNPWWEVHFLANLKMCFPYCRVLSVGTLCKIIVLCFRQHKKLLKLPEIALRVWLLLCVNPVITLHSKLSGAVYCYRSCLWRAGVVGLLITITRNCVHRSSPNWVCRCSVL